VVSEVTSVFARQRIHAGPIRAGDRLRTTDMRSRLFTGGVALLALVALQACAENPPSETGRASAPTRTTSPSTKASEQPNSTRVSAEIIDTEFKPVTLKVEVGSSVHWKQVGDQPHSVTAVDGSFDSSPDCGPLDSDMCLGEGDTFDHVFETAGEFAYYCRVHGLPDGTGMFGTVIVR